MNPNARLNKFEELLDRLCVGRERLILIALAAQPYFS
jgi:hypothetical protein